MKGATWRLCLAVTMAVLVTFLQVSHAGPDEPEESVVTGDMNITEQINHLLQTYLSNITEPLVLEEPLVLRLNSPYMAVLRVTMSNTELAGVKDFIAYDCSSGSHTIDNGLTQNLVLKFKTPKLSITTPAYVMNGTVVDHINLEGKGPASIIIDDLDIRVTENGIIDMKPFNLSDNASLDLEMRRWTVNFEDLMPGTDLGTVFNEFFSAHGQELLDMFEVNYSESGNFVKLFNNIIMNIINNILNHTTTPSTSSTTPSTSFTTPSTSSTTATTHSATTIADASSPASA